MANAGNRNSVLIIAVAAVAIIIAVLALNRRPQPAQPAVALSDVFSQSPATVGAPTASSSASPAAAPADPVPSPAIITAPENGQEAGFMVQVYSFQDHKRAEKALETLKVAGYKAFMEVSDLGEKGTWYRVRIGGLENEGQARAMLDEVRKNYQSGFIVKPKL